ncbi:MAG: NAD(P)-binding domain-containing protein [Symploca sp. SIO2B6]|nr:NAD(P)-binding domain-containing protein [Symploca sp. SIO2B6]
MKQILITHPIHHNTIVKLGLTEKKISRSSINTEEIFLYIPDIGYNQFSQKHTTLDKLLYYLETFQPDILIVGSNAVPAIAITSWRKAVGKNKNLLIIRRGVDTRAIDMKAAQQHNVLVSNLPGINSPYVAQHMIKYLDIKNAKINSKIAIIGTGNIGKQIAIKSIKYGLNPHLFSPSLQDQTKRLSTLLARGINPAKVVCSPSVKEVIQDSTYVAIAIPWLNNYGLANAGIIEEKHINNLGLNAKIVSASVPLIFSIKALTLMNNLAKEKKIFVRIDTSQSRADEVREQYIHLDISHNQAFAASECQIALDEAILDKIRAFT